MRTIEMNAKTVDDAVEAACEALGVDRDDINVSYEVLEMPARKLFKTIPAKIRLTVVEESDKAPAAAEKAQAPAKDAETAPVSAPATKAEETPAAAATPATAPAKAAVSEEEVPLEISEDARLQAAVDYLSPIFKMMGVEDFSFTAFKKGEATILRVTGEHMGALIGRRGETMESLSYLASLVINRMEGDYVKLGLDVGGYRNKREDDLSALAARIAQRVVRTGCYYEMEMMNPYERHIIHAAIAEIDGVRSESKGEGPNRHVVIYSTDPNASNLPDRESQRQMNGRGRRDGRGPRRDGGRGGSYRGGDRGGRGGDRGPRAPRDGNRSGGYRGNRDGGAPRYGAPKSNVPPREFAEMPKDDTLQPVAPSRSERIHDGEDFSFGKIDF